MQVKPAALANASRYRYYRRIRQFLQVRAYSDGGLKIAAVKAIALVTKAMVGSLSWVAAWITPITMPTTSATVPAKAPAATLLDASCPGSAGSQGLIYEIMAVERRPFEGDEQRTLGDGPRIRADIAERHRGGRLQEPGASGLDYFFASKSSHYLSPLCSAWTALRASSRSSK